MLITFLRRIAGAALLDANTYEEVEHDTTATAQAVAVVMLSSLAAGIGLNGSRGAAAALTFFAVTSVMALASWAIFAVITLQVGSHGLQAAQTRVDLGELLRTLGFAAAPGLFQLFALFTPIPLVVLALAFVWTMAASVVAVRQALDFASTTRAVAVCVVGWGLPLAIAATLGAVLSGK